MFNFKKFFKTKKKSKELPLSLETDVQIFEDVPKNLDSMIKNIKNRFYVTEGSYIINVKMYSKVDKTKHYNIDIPVVVMSK